jgi:Icc-related predicted phosphoesterase
MVSSGYSNMTPWHCPRDISEEELGKKVDEMVRRVESFEKCIFNFHTPPYDTPLDLAPELTEDLTPVMSRAGGFNMIHVGSKSVRAAIEKYQPLMDIFMRPEPTQIFEELSVSILEASMEKEFCVVC